WGGGRGAGELLGDVSLALRAKIEDALALVPQASARLDVLFLQKQLTVAEDAVNDVEQRVPRLADKRPVAARALVERLQGSALFEQFIAGPPDARGVGVELVEPLGM